MTQNRRFSNFHTHHTSTPTEFELVRSFHRQSKLDKTMSTFGAYATGKK
jgi:hypothetical protein